MCFPNYALTFILAISYNARFDNWEAGPDQNDVVNVLDSD